MAYIGVEPQLEYWREGTESFVVGAVPQSRFTLARYPATVSSIIVETGGARLPSDGTSYSVNIDADGNVTGKILNVLTLLTPISNVTLYVRYLTTSLFGTTPDYRSIPLARLATSNSYLQNPNANLRGDGLWRGFGIPAQIKTFSGNYTLQAADANLTIILNNPLATTVTVPANVFQVGDFFYLYNAPDMSAFPISIVEGFDTFLNVTVAENTVSSSAIISGAVTSFTLAVTDSALVAAYLIAQNNKRTYRFENSTVGFSLTPVLPATSLTQLTVMVSPAPNTTVTPNFSPNIAANALLQSATTVQFITAAVGDAGGNTVLYDNSAIAFLCIAPNVFILNSVWNKPPGLATSSMRGLL